MHAQRSSPRGHLRAVPCLCRQVSILAPLQDPAHDVFIGRRPVRLPNGSWPNQVRCAALGGWREGRRGWHWAHCRAAARLPRNRIRRDALPMRRKRVATVGSSLAAAACLDNIDGTSSQQHACLAASAHALWTTLQVLEVGFQGKHFNEMTEARLASSDWYCETPGRLPSSALHRDTALWRCPVLLLPRARGPPGAPRMAVPLTGCNCACASPATQSAGRRKRASSRCAAARCGTARCLGRSTTHPHRAHSRRLFFLASAD